MDKNKKRKGIVPPLYPELFSEMANRKRASVDNGTQPVMLKGGEAVIPLDRLMQFINTGKK